MYVHSYLWLHCTPPFMLNPQVDALLSWCDSNFHVILWTCIVTFCLRWTQMQSACGQAVNNILLSFNVFIEWLFNRVKPARELCSKGKKVDEWKIHVKHLDEYVVAGWQKCKLDLKNSKCGASLVAQWLGICLPMQGTWVRALVWEDPTCRRATRPVSHNCWACASGACAQQQERPRQWEAHAPR